MNTDAIKVATIRAVKKVQGEPGEPKWPTGFTAELLYQMRNEELIDWIEAESKRYSGTASLPTAFIKMRQYKLGR